MTIPPDQPSPLQPRENPLVALWHKLIAAATPILITLFTTLLTLAWIWADGKIDELKKGQQDAKKAAEVAVVEAAEASTTGKETLAKITYAPEDIKAAKAAKEELQEIKAATQAAQ